MNLDSVLDDTIDLLQHPEFKTIGALRKHQYQMEKTKYNEDDMFKRRVMYENQIVLPEQRLKFAENLQKIKEEDPEAYNARFEKSREGLKEWHRKQKIKKERGEQGD